jgi:ABC-type antimicrobial peptide transport system permease subunit
MLYVNSQKYKKINRNVKNFTAHHPVFHPQYLNPGLYDDDLYYKCIDAQIEHVKRYGVDNQDKIIADIEFYYNHKSKTTIYDPNYSKQQLCRAVRQFEIIQKQDWARTFPVLTEQINRFNNE